MNPTFYMNNPAHNAGVELTAPRMSSRGLLPEAQEAPRTPRTRPEPRRMSSSIRRWFKGPSAPSPTADSDDVARQLSQGHKVLNHLAGIPLREGLQILYKIRRTKFMCELLLFLCFFSVFLYIVLEAYPVHSGFVQGAAVSELLLDEEFPGASFKKNFHELETMEDYWDWLEGPLLHGMFPVAWYNGDPFSEDQLGYVQSYDRLVGPIELRQLRVGNGSCTQRRFLQFGKRYDTKDGTCFAEFTTGDLFTPSTESKEPFGPDGRYTYTSKGLGRLFGKFGFGPQDYGDGGFVTYLRNNLSDATAVLQQLKADRWVDRGTRAVSHTINLYNTNTRLLSTVRIVVEFFPSGFLAGSWTFFTTRVVLYHSRLAVFRGFMECIFLLLLVYQTQKEVKRCYHTHPRLQYFLQQRNLFEVVFLTSNFGMVVSWILVMTDRRRRAFDVNRLDYVNYFPVATNFSVAFTFGAVVALLSCLKLFKFLSINKRMSTLWLTLQRATYDLAMFFIGFVFIIVGFGFAAYLLFGHVLRDFHSVPASVSSLTRFVLSDFNYDELSIARPLVAPVFFWMYNVVVFCVALNTFIAIITLYFEEVHRDAKLSDKWKEGMPDLTYDLIKIFRRFGRKLTEGRLRFLYVICCCVCFRSKFRKRKVVTGDKARCSTGLSMQLEVWEREATFEQLFREASRAAKRRHRSVDLFRYFDRAFREVDNKSNLYIGLSELCMLTSDVAACPHNDCLARALIYAYGNLKDVVLLSGQERHSQPVTLLSTARHTYEVTKINKWGRKQRRILSIDMDKREMQGYDLNNNLKRVLPLAALVQIDKSVPDPRRLNLVFAEPVGTQYHLLFDNGTRRDEFVLKVFEAVKKKPRHGFPDDDEPPSIVPMTSAASPLATRGPESKALGGPARLQASDRQLLSESPRPVSAGAATRRASSAEDDLAVVRRTVMSMQDSLKSITHQVRRQSMALLPQQRFDPDDW